MMEYLDVNISSQQMIQSEHCAALQHPLGLGK